MYAVYSTFATSIGATIALAIEWIQKKAGLRSLWIQGQILGTTTGFSCGWKSQ